MDPRLLGWEMDGNVTGSCEMVGLVETSGSGPDIRSCDLQKAK